MLKPTLENFHKQRAFAGIVLVFFFLWASLLCCVAPVYAHTQTKAMPCHASKAAPHNSKTCDCHPGKFPAIIEHSKNLSTLSSSSGASVVLAVVSPGSVVSIARVSHNTGQDVLQDTSPPLYLKLSNLRI